MLYEKQVVKPVRHATAEMPSFLELLESDARAYPRPPQPELNNAQPLVGEVLDTHNPDCCGRVLVRWASNPGEACQRWLAVARGAAPRKSDRVLLQQPANWPEMLVTSVIEGLSSAQSNVEESQEEPLRIIELEHEEKLRITGADGQPLIEVYASTQGPVVRLMNQNVDLEIPGKLRLRAETLELEGGRGGIDIRTEADTVVRGRYIRLN